jgi:hypothetical protein
MNRLCCFVEKAAPTELLPGYPPGPVHQGGREVATAPWPTHTKLAEFKENGTGESDSGQSGLAAVSFDAVGS